MPTRFCLHLHPLFCLSTRRPCEVAASPLYSAAPRSFAGLTYLPLCCPCTCHPTSFISVFHEGPVSVGTHYHSVYSEPSWHRTGIWVNQLCCKRKEKRQLEKCSVNTPKFTTSHLCCSGCGRKAGQDGQTADSTCESWMFSSCAENILFYLNFMSNQTFGVTFMPLFVQLKAPGDFPLTMNKFDLFLYLPLSASAHSRAGGGGVVA